MALGSDGEYYNINADQMASACAVACHADTLIFLTDVDGVKDADGAVMRWLSTRDVAALVRVRSSAAACFPSLQACSRRFARA